MPDMRELIIEAAANEDDIAWAAHLMAGNEPWITLGRGYEQSREALTRSGTELFIARMSSERVALLLLSPYGLAGSPYINSIAVDRAHRAAGIGTRLLEFAEQKFRARRFIFLCVSSFNQRAEALYRRCGYELVGELKDYVVEGKSELLYRKRLTRNS